MYCFGDPAKMSDDKSRLALRIHDEVSPEKLPFSVDRLTRGIT